MMNEISRPAHSPLGASGAERWMNCPGSVALIRKLALPETDEPEYRKEGIAGHEAAAYCLTEKLDTWEIIGREFHGITINAEMATAVQTYLDAVRPSIGDWPHFVEYSISSKIHDLFYGTADFAAITPAFLDVTDLKMGEGLIVEPERNQQCMYYAFGFIDGHPELPDDFPVRIRIVQPRAFHHDGPIREWWTTCGSIRQWAFSTLIPAMEAASFDAPFMPGQWCRFCPAKLMCPALTNLFGAATKADPRSIVTLSDEQLGRDYQFRDAVKHYLKAQEEEAFRRLHLGREVPGTKLVNKKANRVFRDGAEALFKARFGSEAVTEPALKSPAEMERVSPEAKELVHEWAYMPQTGLTVATEDDRRVGVKVQSSAEIFKAVGPIEGDSNV